MIHGVPTGLYSNDEPLPHIPFHGLRHTSAALLIAQHQVRKGRHFIILKRRLFLFPETTAAIRNEVKL